MLCLVTHILCNPMDCSPPGISVHGDSPSKNTKVGCHALLQGTFLTQRSNPGLPYCRRILYYRSHQGEAQEYWSGWPIPSPGDLLNPGIEPGSLELQVGSLPAEISGKPSSNHATATAKSLQSCLTLCDPIDGSPPGSLVLGFSRQEHWSGLPFPSPTHESEK